MFCKSLNGESQLKPILIVLAIGFLLISGNRYCLRAAPVSNVSALEKYDKKIALARDAHLQNQAEPNVYSGDNLKYIGMPVGGICAGTVYIGGDGTLWNWDVFNVRTLDPGGPGDKFYLKPMQPEKRFEQGFVIKTGVGSQHEIRPLNSDGFKNIEFVGQYPVATVQYADNDFPVQVFLKAFSPFIPTDADDSGLPATVIQYTLTNTSSKDVEVELAGYLQNAVCLFNANNVRANRVNRAAIETNVSQLLCTAKEQRTNETTIRPDIVFTDSIPNAESISGLPDYGSMALSLLDRTTGDWVTVSCENEKDRLLSSVFSTDKGKKNAAANMNEKLIGSVGRKLKLSPGEQQTVTFAVSWFFPNLHTGSNGLRGLRNMDQLRAYYSKRFDSAGQVGQYIQKNSDKLINSTLLWNRTWYDSTLPKWFLNRIFIPADCLATTVFQRFTDLTGDRYNDGRIYGWEGVYQGFGTCTHVLHYEQAMGRLFPNMTRQLREQVDYGLSFRDDGVIRYRGEHGSEHAVDGHCGTILRTWREHTMSPDNTFLKRNYSKIKKSIEVLIAQDKQKTGVADGILEGPQYNTLDRVWYGKIPWISSMYCAALRAGAAMASESGDTEFAGICTNIADTGYKNIPSELFNGEYFIQKIDPERLYAPNVNVGCHIDQMLGQSWAAQVSLSPVLPPEKTHTALKSLFKYNFQTDVGPYIENAQIKPVRFFALPGEAGTVICSFPKGGADRAPGNVRNDWERLVVGYFSECMTGFEYQAAAQMIDEGLAAEGFAVVKAIDDRYHPSKRNPFNEVEYGNHYSRAMSSYGCIVAACGFEYHGPKGVLGFAPKLSPENFRAPFTVAQGWGTFSQTQHGKMQTERIELRYGVLSLSQLKYKLINGVSPSTVKIEVDGRKVGFKYDCIDCELSIVVDKKIHLKAGSVLNVEIK